MLSAHLAVIKNPFSTAVPTAKVPDGRSPTSLSTRWHVSDSVASTSGKFLFVLQPSPTCPLISAGVTTNAVNYTYNAGPSEFSMSVQGKPTGLNTIVEPALVSTEPTAISIDITDGTTASFPVALDTAPKANAAPTENDIQIAMGANTPEKWRLVSQGLRLTPINNAELNSGWFEAIRVPSSYNLQETALVYNVTPAVAPALPTITSPSLSTIDLKSFEQGVAFRSNWANYPGYISGKVRDLPRHVFYLQTIGDRCFHNSNDLTYGKTFGTKHSRLLSLNDDITGFIDTTFDTVMIRIHGVPSQGDSQVPALHYHCVSNIEHIQQANSILKRFESRCVSAESIVKKTDVLINRDPKPSIIRLYKE